MHPYIGWAGDRSAGAVLVFARESRAAKPVAFGLLMGWFDVEYTDVRVKRLRDHTDWLMTHARPRMITAGLAHGTDEVPSCCDCHRWHGPLDADNRCSECAQQQITEAA
ncbi:hypothetical protein [Luteimonas fraxinea]|uniref:Uncharacterized protein n=1 Tax=Luteimonas fraxinea TaxID=2901869 RepID=A0ABS8UC45_9GAMM|nr:hypothetical protein [Luteimonas fraxinea]MCD9097080.1 hypothetical protein [Luteimonas fraxinea]